MKDWIVDTAHSEIGFSVKHMMISKVKGTFSSYRAILRGNEDDIEHAHVGFSIDVSSINTNNDDRDNHLRSPDFFDVDQFPEIRFVSTHISKTDENLFLLTGDLTIKNITKPVTFTIEFGGKGTNPWGVEVIAFEAKGKINRKDFGLSWNQALETGGVLVGDEIKINISIEANPSPPTL